MENELERSTSEEAMLEILRKADEHAGDNEIKPSEFWNFRERVRVGYGLPECAGRWDDPVGYIHQIEEFASKHGIDVRPKHEFETYFRERPDAGAVAFSEDVFRRNTVVVEGFKPDDRWALRARANQLSHEIVHAMQATRYPSMPEELAEWEAYAYQWFTPELIREHEGDPDFLVYHINNTIREAVASSVSIANPKY